MDETPLRYRSSARSCPPIPRKCLTSSLTRAACLQEDLFVDSDVTSTPLLKLQGKFDSAALLVSPISHVEESGSLTFASFLEQEEEEAEEQEEGREETNVWRQEKWQTGTVDSGYVTTEMSTRRTGEGNSTSSLELSTPLRVCVSPTAKSTRQEGSMREKMFAALDRDFRFRWLRRERFEIGRFTDCPQVDVISAIDDYDCSGFLLSFHLLPFLSPCSLRRMRLVSRRWRDIVHRFSKDRWRYRPPPERLKRRLISSEGKENSGSPLCCAVCSPSSFAAAVSLSSPEWSEETENGGMLRRGALKTTQQVGASPVIRGKEGGDMWTKFMSATTSLLHSEHLGRCPSCGGPSRVHPATRRAVCTESSCGFDYCSFCLYAYHESRPCRRKISPTRDISLRNSPEKRQTKRRLKRL